MRIAVFHHLPSGGALKLVAQSASLLAARGHEVALFTFSSAEQEFAPWPVQGTVEVEPLELGGAGELRRYRRATRALAARIAAWRPDVAWVEKCRLIGHPPIVNALAVPTVLHTHEPRRMRALEALAPVDTAAVGVEAPPSPRHGPREFLAKLPRAAWHWRVARADRAAIRGAGRVLTSSQFTVEWLRRAYGVSARVLAPGVDTARFAPSHAPRERRIVTVGRLVPWKGHDFVLDVLAGLPADARPAWDVVCDEVPPDERARFEARARAAAIAVRIHERIGEERLVQLYQTARVVLCAAVREPFGLVPPEAMASGTPVIAVREGGFAETVDDGVTGTLLPRDAAQWREALLRYLHDDALVSRQGAAGVARVQAHWSAAGWVERAAAASGLPLTSA